MSKETLEKQDSCCDQQRLDEEIRELIISLEKQNALLSDYYEKITLKPLDRLKKNSLRNNEPVFSQKTIAERIAGK